ncbi:methyl-accepting chemotaxis protein [Alkaliphilus serpentinus]|uniref:Methyl-accepting transducer domain-containing protein n=1 Tax=Alkaliphilus serpentinus TaxID=1482731 RepID=A0A833HLQ1_9FIRM|nr:methyl-accepting chemotaxis protein [Alkaliphilus serpentinus]KAB3526351.1 hypothetical protein F8153_13915 [Alkaliphilus serpentinus]
MSLVSTVFAQRLVELINKETQQNAHFFGDGGVIIATTQPERLGTVHQGAKDIMAGKLDYIAITEEMTKTMSGTRPGFSIGIDTNGRRIGAIGISGEPQQMKPIALLASNLIALEYERVEFLTRMNSMAEDINESIQESSAGLQELSATTDHQAEAIMELNSMIKATKEQVLETNKIIDLIHSISKQTNILGINASIEAARIGAEGKGFNIVANEVRKLAESTATSVNQISRVLKNIQDMITTASDQIESYTHSSKEQLSVVHTLTKELENIAISVDDFTQKLK